FQLWQHTTVAGTVFNDANGNGQQGAGEPGVAGVTVYLDLENNGQVDPGDPTTSSLNDGTYEFVGLAGGTTYTVRYELPDDYLASAGPRTYSVPVGVDPYVRYDGNDFALAAEPLTARVNTLADAVTPDDVLSLREAVALANGTLRIAALTPQEQAQV